MAQPYENKAINDVLELLTTNGFEGMAEAVTVLLNSAMVAEILCKKASYCAIFV